MPNWKKVAISGSNISQFNNDGVYTKMSGSTANGLLTYVNSETASVEPNITYDGSIQRLVNNGQINNYSGSYTVGQEPAMGTTTSATFSSLLSSAAACYTPTGSKNAIVYVVGRHSTFGSGGECGATLSITSQVGNSSKNATTQLTSIGKEDGCHDAIFTIGLKCDDITPEGKHPVHEMFRLDGRDRDVTFSGSLLVQPTYMSTSASLDRVLVHDSTTGEIKVSSITPPSSNSVTSVNGQTGVVTLSIPTNNNQLSNGAGYITSAPVTSVNGATGVVTTTDKCVGTVCGENASGTATNVTNVDTIEFQCAAISTATNEATVKIHSATNASNKAELAFPDANNQLIGCSNIYVCTNPSNGHQGSLYNNGGGIVGINNNGGTYAVPSSVSAGMASLTWVGPGTGTSDASNQAAPIYNIRSNTVGGYATQNATSSFVVSTAQNTSNTTDNNNFSRIRLTHVDCNNLTFASADLETISIGTNGTYCETSAFSVNVRGNDQLYYRRLYIESSDSSMTPKNANIILSGSVHVDTSQMNTSASLTSVLVYDNATGEIKKSSLTPSEGGGTPAGSAGSIQYANATVDAFDGESAFTYNETSNLMSVDNIMTQCITGDGNNVTITDGDNDACVFMCSFGTEKMIYGECDTSIGEASNTNASVINRAKVKIPDGTSSKPGIAFTNDPDMGLYRSGTSAILGLSDSLTVATYNFTTDGLKIEDGALAVGNITPSSTTGRIDASNDIVAYSTSDCRLKKYVKPIKNALDKIDQIRGVEFDWKVTDEKMEKEVHSFEGHDVGVIAQEIEAVLPEVVTTRDSGYKAVRYDKIVPLLIQGIKELKDEVEILKSKI